MDEALRPNAVGRFEKIDKRGEKKKIRKNRKMTNKKQKIHTSRILTPTFTHQVICGMNCAKTARYFLKFRKELKSKLNFASTGSGIILKPFVQRFRFQKI